MKIGDNIKKRRVELKMSQDKLAQKLGYKSRSSINKIEKGYTDINQNKVIEFAKVLGTTPAYLSGWNEQEDDLKIVIYNSLQNLTREEQLEVIDFIDFVKFKSNKPNR